MRDRSPDLVAASLQQLLGSFEMITWHWKETIATGVGFVKGNVWSRAYRRRKSGGKADGKKKEGDAKMRDVDGADESTEDDDEEDEDEDEDDAALGFKVRVVQGSEPESEGARVEVRWLKGMEPVLFESFCGMLKRKLDGAGEMDLASG